MKDYNKALKAITAVIAAGQTIAIHDKLAEVEYDDGTLLDFFTQDYDDVSDDLTVLYPLVAALSAGQKAGIEFVSLKVVVGSTEVPAGYTTGIHMFGTDAAFNLNSSLYDWNNDAPSVYVYFSVEDDTATETGSNFTGGMLALAGGGGIALGAIVTALAMKTKRKKAAKA